MELIIILGPTAVGKTKLAVRLAAEVNGEIISADSRQIYKELSIGSGKDLDEYRIDGRVVPHHLIDRISLVEEYNVFRFQEDFFEAYREICKRRKKPILCGGTGLYLEAAMASHKMLEVPFDSEFRKKAEKLSMKELKEVLQNLNTKLHNQTDLTERKRTLRAIEIERYKQEFGESHQPSPIKSKVVFGIFMERSKLRERIKERLDHRLSNGMIEEVEDLLKSGHSLEKLKWFGLEYKFLAAYLSREIKYDQMYESLLQAIRQFAKKQMSRFRRMERNGTRIHWIDAELPIEEKIKRIKNTAGYGKEF